MSHEKTDDKGMRPLVHRAYCCARVSGFRVEGFRGPSYGFKMKDCVPQYHTLILFGTPAP